MKRNKNKRTVFAASLAVMLCMAQGAAHLVRATARQQRAQNSRGAASTRSGQAVAAFEQRAREYANLREQLEEKLPKLPKESTAEEIAAHKTAFQQAVLSARVGAKPGDIFSPAVAAHIRAMIKRDFRGSKLRELRETVLEAETKGVPLRVNYPYPESKELLDIPPTLLLKLPQLPKQLRYRFVGRHLLLVDRENGLIIDYMRNAVP